MKRLIPYSLFLILYSVMIFAAPKIMAFTGPTCTAPGSCSLITASGTNLGIGTTTPNQTLTVSKSSGGIAIMGGENVLQFQENNGTADNVIYYNSNSASNNLYIGRDSSNLYLRTGGNIKLAIVGSNVGIGSSTPGYPLTVTGNVYTTGSFIGTLSGGLSAANISSDVFGRLQGNGNFAFPASLGVATTTQNGLPQTLSVYGGGYFSGNVGIGTTSPSYPLQVAGNCGNANCKNFDVNYPGGGALAGTELSGLAYPSADGYSLWAALYAKGGTGGAAAGLFNGNTYFMNGNVGIGTSTPQTNLDVNGGGNWHPVNIESTNSTGVGIALLPNATYPGYLINGGNSGANANLFQIDQLTDASHATARLTVNVSTGNVGIGTSTPQARLDVQGTGTGHVLIGPYASNPSYGAISLNGNGLTPSTLNFLSGSSDANLYINRPSGAGIYFQEGGTSGQLTLLSGGNVGIGTSTPPDNLTVYANNPTIGLRNPDGTYAFFQKLSTASGGYFRLYDGTNYSLVSNAGKIGIGTTTPAYPLTVNGQIASLSGGVVFPDGSVQTTAYGGGTQQTNAAYVTQGTFGSSVSGSNNQYYIKPTTNTTASFGVLNSGGTSVLDVDTTNQRVGIGTASPNSTLDVNGQIGADGAIGITGNPSSVASNIGWKIGLYSNAYAIGVANYTTVLKTGSWVSVFSGNPANNANVSTPDSNAAVSLGTNGNIVASGGITAGGASTFNNQVTINGTLNLGTNSISMSTVSSTITVNKLNVNTIDPVYNIGGQNYATYGPDIIGLNTEDFGKGMLQNGEYVIDFKNAPKGSDLWLFWQTINEGPGMQNIIVTLTPQGGQASLWYDLNPAAEQIVVHGNKDVAFSYHLVAPRYDSEKWGNLTESPPGATLPVK